MGCYERSDVEDVTGCIPLLLEKCVVREKVDLTVVALRDIYDKAVSFVQQMISEKMGAQYEWDWYVRLIWTLGTLLTYQVLRVRDGLHPSLPCTKWIQRAFRPD